MATGLQLIANTIWQRLARYPLLHTDAEKMEFILSLRPQEDDYRRVFRPEAQEAARQAYTEIWKEPALWPLRPDQTELKVVAATVEDIKVRAPHTAEFPGGYHLILHHYQPQTVLLCWEFMAPEFVAGMAFDGLVAIPHGNRWAWFPKPWHVLPPTPSAALDHWTAS